MNYNKIIPYLILLFISIAFSGCHSSHIENIETSQLEPYDIDAPQYYQIMYVHMKDTSIVDMFGKNPRYLKKYKDVKRISALWL